MTKARVNRAYARQGGLIGGRSRMAQLTREERRSLSRAGALARWARNEQHQKPEPPAVAISQMLKAIEKTGRKHLLFVQGDQTWCADYDDPERAHQKNIRTWLSRADSDPTDDAVPAHEKIWLIGTYQPGSQMTQVMSDLLAVATS